MSVTTIPSRRQRGRPLAADGPVHSEEAYLAAALRAFADLGFEGASVREVARHMGVSHGLIHAKFGSKQKLWEAALDHGLGKVHAAILTVSDEHDPAAPVADRMRAVFEAFLLGIADNSAILQLINSEGARGGERLDRIAQRFLLGRRSPMARLFEEGVASGAFRPVDFGTTFFLLAHGGGAALALGPLARKLGLATDEAAIRRRAAEAADQLVRAISA